MSRGGRGGRGGGPPGAPGSRLNHGTVPFEISPELLAQVESLHKNSGLFPHMDVPRPRPLTRAEYATVEAYRELRAKRHLGPYYFPSTSRDESNRRSKRRRAIGTKASMFNSFEDQKTYLAQQDDIRRAHKEAEYVNLPFPKSLLPKELWQVCGIAKGAEFRPTGSKKKSLLSFSQKIAQIDETEEAEDEKKDDIEDLDDKDPNASDKEDDEDKDEAASDRDDDFEDDEDDMAADYNAEQYFDGGEDDNDDVGHGGDGGGGDDW